MNTDSSYTRTTQQPEMVGKGLVLNGKSYKTLAQLYTAVSKNKDLKKGLMRPKRERILTGIPRSEWSGTRIKFNDNSFSESRERKAAEKEARKAAREERARLKEIEKQEKEARKFKRENDAALKRAAKMRKLHEKSEALAAQIQELQEKMPSPPFKAALTSLTSHLKIDVNV